MNVLVLNCGSSSLKYQLISMENEMVLAKGLCERIGIAGSKLKHSPHNGEDFLLDTDMPDHQAAVKLVLDALLDAKHGVIKSIAEVNAVGHRVVHGGEMFSDSVLITNEVKKAIEDCCELAPLHNPPNLIGIRAIDALMPETPQVAVFDTAFHQSIPDKAFLYAIPMNYYKKYKIRRYGFHGTSHKFVSMRAADVLNRPYDSLKIISCHLGNGASVCAIQNGKSVDTSMGLTPLEGLAMGTRSGDIDPAVIPFIIEKEKITVKDVENILNKQSGVLGLSGVSSDFRDIEAEGTNGNQNAKAALELYYYRVAKYIGSYAAAMNGVDAIVFTAGLGENSKATREKICSYLGFLGITLDDAKNSIRGEEIDITTDISKVRVLVIPTNEELVIARDTALFVK